MLVPVLTAFTVRSAKVTDKGALAHETTAVVEPFVESLAVALHAPRPRHMTASSAGAVLEFVVTSIKMLVTTQTLRTPFTAHQRKAVCVKHLVGASSVVRPCIA